MKNYVEKVRQKMEERRQLKRIKLNLIEANIKDLKIDGKTKYANVLSALNSMLLEYLAKDEYFSEMRVLNFVSDISCYMADNVSDNANINNKVGERIELIVNYSAINYRASCFNHHCLTNTKMYCQVLHGVRKR